MPTAQAEHANNTTTLPLVPFTTLQPTVYLLSSPIIYEWLRAQSACMLFVITRKVKLKDQHQDTR